jgi:hypothetical protein
MSRSRRGGLARAGLLGVLGALVLMVSGDRRAQTAPGPDIGIDPLEILNLQIRANALIVLDSSGSMGQTLEAAGAHGDLAGDDPDSKLFQAKETLKAVIAANERKVSFQFGQYEQPGIGAQSASVMTVPTTGIGRFLYTTTSVKAASMGTNELIVDLRSTVLPVAQVIRIREGTSTTTIACPVAAGRYGTEVMLANAVATAMSNCVAGGNTYAVTVLNTHRFRIARSAGTLTFIIRWNEMQAADSDTLRQRLGGNTTNTGSVTTFDPPNAPAGFDRDLLRNTTAGNAEGKFTEGTKTYYKLYARRYYNGQTVRVRPDGIACDINPLPGGTGVGGNGTSEAERPWVDLRATDANCVDLASGQLVRFTFSSVPRNGNFVGTTDDGEWRTWAGNTTCGGYEALVGLQPCTNNAQLALVTPFLEKEIRISAANRWPVGYAEDATTGAVTSQPTVGGMRAAGNTPIGESLSDIDNTFTTALWPVIRNYGGGNGPYPKTFVIFLTDGDDTCETPDGGNALTADEQALRAAHRAQMLFTSVEPSPPATPARGEASSVTTFVISYGTGASASRANWIAWGGSGMTRATTNEGGAIGLRWTDAPATKEAGGCPQCKNAFLASDTAELAAILQSVIEQGQTVGIYSDQQSVTESIFELVYKAPDARDPLASNRYEVTLPVLLQSTFAMPTFDGHLKAFRRAASGSVMEWDAGQQLQQRVAAGMSSSPTWSFSALRGGASTTDANIAASTAGIKRRIYTTLRNGVYGATVTDLLNQTSTQRTTLWPPTAAIDPPAAGTTYPAGLFDTEMGLALLDFATLQTTFGACTASVPANLPADCTAATRRAWKEAREIVLAYMAGAQLVKEGSNAVRNTLTKEIQFAVRPWILAESTLAAPAAVGPPADEVVGVHQPEFNLFISGGTAASRRMGFGLRKPASGSQPVMSVVYHSGNDMLHAFRGGPCNVGNACSGFPGSVIELGGEELWGFVPYDLLGALKERLKPQTRASHTFMLATPLRFADVWVPGTFSVSPDGTPLAGSGVWRVVLFFGRGIGGKYLTALDVTAPGEFTVQSLNTNPPIPLWSRGNPDTQNGLPAGVANNNAADALAYTQMGQTWSVPAIALVKAGDNITTRKPSGVEFVAYVGSGYGNTTGCPSSSPCEGARFYTLDALTGDVVASANVGQRNNSTAPFANVIVAGPSAFAEDRVTFNPAGGVSENSKPVTRAYFNDIHGRLWRVMSNAPGTVQQLADVNGSGPTQQPLGVSTALLSYDPTGSLGVKPMIFIESGNDNRIFLPTDAVPTTPPFHAWAYADLDTSAQLIFTKDFPNLYRGTTQPATAFSADGLGRVFFGGTRFNPAGTLNAPPPPPCRSSFSSILFALGAGTGNAAYQLGAGHDEYLEYLDEKIMSNQVVRGQVVVDRGLGADIAPTPPPSIEIEPPDTDGSVFAGLNVPERYSIPNRDTQYTALPTVCR